MNSITAIQNVSQVPSKLNRTETAVAANKLATARTVNGVNFDGTANITTSTWGTSRSITIGNSKKAVNGSADVSWSLSDIGAATSSHTHSEYITNDRIMDGAQARTYLWSSDYIANNYIDYTATAAAAKKLSTGNTGHSTQPVYFSDGKPVSTPSYFTRNTQGDIGWGSANNNSPVTVSAIAYWNGAYSGSASNLTYCIHGALGNIVTKNQGDYASASHNHNSSYLSLSGGTVSGKINTSQLAIGGRNLTISSSAPSAATGDVWIQI